MDDGLLGFLIFVGIMIISIVHNKRKEAMEEAAKKAAPKVPKKVVVQDHTTNKAKNKPSFRSQRNTVSMPGDRTTSSFNRTRKSIIETPEEEPQDFSFQSLDDVKKGFVWSEILRRKY